MRKLSRSSRPGGKKIEPHRNRPAWAWYFIIPAAMLLVAFSPWRRTMANFFYPYLILPAHGTEALSQSTLMLRSKSDLVKELRALEQKNFALVRQQAEAEKIAAENRELRALLNLAPRTGYHYLACDVVLRDPWLWEGGFTISRGSEDGLQPGFPVIAAAPDGSGRTVLLGVIESVANHSARVISVLNREFRLSVRLPESDAIGFLNAAEERAANGLAIDFLPANATFALHEPVYTTGFEALIPDGLYLGVVEAVEPTSLPFGDRLYRRVLMRPAAELQKLRTVMVACPGERKAEP